MATPGIRIRHSRSCPTRTGGQCPGRKTRDGEGCEPAFEASVYSRRDGRKLRKTFPTLGAAKSWRTHAASSVANNKLRAPTSTTLRQAATAFLNGAREGQIRTRSGDVYKPSVLRSYESALRLRVLPNLGARKLSDIQRVDLQDLADRMLAKGLDPSTVRNSLMPLRAIFRRAVSRGELAVNPTTGLELPAVRGRRDRVASPAEAAELLAVLPDADRGLWACAMYGGLRRGELMALRSEDVDLSGGVLRVERSWDVEAGPIEPKSQAGIRQVPIPAVLRDYIVEHKLRTGRSVGLVFGRTQDVPFQPSGVRSRAESAWRHKRRERAAGLAQADGFDFDELAEPERKRFLDRAGFAPIGLHECRHTFASLMIAAGVNAKALSTFMGHLSITITLDRYGHMFPGSEDEAASLLDAYLERSNTQARLAQLEPSETAL
jgi:integrase